VHARWFHTEHHLEALDRFIDELMSLEDVYIVTPIQVKTNLILLDGGMG
jgi:hypothetical protein